MENQCEEVGTGTHLYSPEDKPRERRELAQLQTATRSVDAAMYSFTDRELAEELATLVHKGVRIRVYRGSRAVWPGDAGGRGHDKWNSAGGRGLGAG